jgi:hypothetical protein
MTNLSHRVASTTPGGIRLCSVCVCHSQIRVQEKFEDTKEVIRGHKSKKDKQYNGQKKKEKKDLQNATHTTND